METTYLRGGMYYANLEPGVGSEQNGHRPVVIIQNNIGNKYSPTVIVAAITGKVGIKAKLPTHYYIGAGDGLEQPSIVLLEQLRTIDKKRLESYIGHLSQKHIDGINHALAVSLDLIHKIYDALIISLCPVCEQHFRNTGSYYVYHLDPEQLAKDTCTYCSKRMGFDCVIIRKK
ncbi:MAG: type II toxin-antitoxin system PemK/MazF family toxin [Oscillospiraceae bacterium]